MLMKFRKVSADRNASLEPSQVSARFDLRGEVKRANPAPERLFNSARRELRGEVRRALFLCGDDWIQTGVLFFPG